ncbi:TPA: hypothetical protein DIV55_03105 [Patescibacteria group bacterium]|nr:hypothetical protein [Patescibacteria group bacterium]
MHSETQLFIDLLLGMTQKELQARYKRTVFGFLWVVINPVLQMVVIGFIFRFFIKEPIINYYFYLLIGLLMWNFFTLSLTKATPSIVFERSLIKKARFPRMVIPLSIVLSNFVHFVLSLILFIPLTMFVGIFSFTTLPALLLAIALLLLFTIGLSLLTSALNVRFRDVNFFVQALLIIWFYATPIVYSISVVPRDVIWLWRLNPLTAIVQLFQYALVEAPGPGPAMITLNTLEIMVILGLGWYTFQKLSKEFDDWV